MPASLPGNLMLETPTTPTERRDPQKELGEVSSPTPNRRWRTRWSSFPSGDFDAGEYGDTYRESLKGIIQQKLEGLEIVSALEAPVAQASDSMEVAAAFAEGRQEAARGRSVEANRGLGLKPTQIWCTLGELVVEDLLVFVFQLVG
ncbi:MAG: hypothetical protein U0S12_00205 [Fimbriimonadales bacterium]